MRIVTISALGLLTLGSAFFAACGSDSSGGNTGGATTVGGGGAPVGGAGGTPSGGAPSGGGGTSASGGMGGGSGGGTSAVTMPASCVKPGTVITNCNPVTNEGCSGAGVACDLSDQNSFECFDPPNDVPKGGACDLSKGPFCQPKHACVQKICYQYCCTDSDCTAGGTCKAFDANAGTLGYCDGGSTTDGGSDSGSGGTGGSDAGSGGSDAAADSAAD